MTFPRYKAEKSPSQQHDLSILIVGPIHLKRLFALWGVGVVFEASRGSWTVSWDDDRTQELASGASSTKTRTQFGYPNFLQRQKTLQFQRCDFNV